MTTEALIAKLTEMTGEINEDILLTYLNIAKEKVLHKCYPFRHNVEEVPEKYQYVQLEIAQYLYNKRGAEGETAHNENGINRTYESASVPDSMLKEVISHAAIF